jgi:hypothetical protein
MKALKRILWTLPVLLGLATGSAALAPPPTSVDARGTVIASFARGSGVHQMGITENTLEAPAIGPTGLVDTEREGVFILDAVNARILRVSPNGKAELAATLRPNSLAQDILRQGASVYVLEDEPVYVGSDSGTGKLRGRGAAESTGASASAATALFEANGAVLTQRGGTPESSGSEPGMGRWLRGSSRDGQPLEYRTVRAGDGAVRVEVRGAQPASTTVLPIPIQSALLGSTSLLGTDADGRHYVRAEQFAQQQGVGRAKVWVLRYRRDGSFDGGYDVPDEALELVPNRYLALSRAGKLFFMESRTDSTRLWSLAPFAPADFSRRQEETMRRIATTEEPLAIGPGGPKPNGSQEAATSAAALSRADILATAEAYRTTKWLVSPANYRSGAVSACLPASGKLWKRPGPVEGQMGKLVEGVPYNWGGYDSLSQFTTRIAQNAVGGNICTCRSGYNCVNSKAAGVDCSGFVSRTWDTRRYTTVSLMQAARRLPSYKELKPGDALNKPNSHVRLFVSLSPAGNGSIRAYEASASCGKVCLRDFSSKQLEGYLPLAAPVRD